MRAVVLRKVPDPNTSTTVTTNDLALVGVDNYVVDWRAMKVAALNRAASSLPDLDSTILRARNHPFSLTVESYARDVTSVTFESQERVGVRGLDVIELDGMVTSSREESLVGGDAESIDLGVRMLNGSRADTREGLPKPGESSGQ